MIKHKLTVLTGALLLGLGGAAAAGEKNKPAQQAGMENRTQTTTQSESATHGPAVSGFARGQADVRTTPPASPPGHSVSQVARSQGNWMQLDADGDGTLSDAEIAADAQLAADLDTYDSDGDGQLTRAEFDAYVLANVETDVAVEDDAQE